jgi:hypothetical protein
LPGWDALATVFGQLALDARIAESADARSDCPVVAERWFHHIG